MEIMNEITARRSVRSYKPDPVGQEDILALLEAARQAPSGNNNQPWRFKIIQDEETKQRIIAADHHQQWMATAPVFIACLADLRCRTKPGEELSPANFRRMVRDTAVSVGYLLLQAQHLGLGTCWTGWYDQQAMREALSLPEYYYISGVVTVGYPAEAPEARPRLPLEELILP